MPKSNKYFKTGEVREKLECKLCERMYRGNHCTINKLMTLHMLKEHNITRTANNKPDIVTRTTNAKNEC